MYDDALPATGGGAMLIAGHEIGMPAVVTFAAGLIVAGLLAYRFAVRARRATTRR